MEIKECLNYWRLHCTRPKLLLREAWDRSRKKWLDGGLGEEKVGYVYNLCWDCHQDKQTTERFSQCFYTIQFMPVLCAPELGWVLVPQCLWPCSTPMQQECPCYVDLILSRLVAAGPTYTGLLNIWSQVKHFTSKQMEIEHLTN